MELPNRPQLEREFAERIGALTTRQRQRLRELIGSPPNPNNAPESFWVEVQRETEAEVLAALYLLFLESAAFHGGSRLGLDIVATDWSRRRAVAVGVSHARTTREQFGKLAGRMLRPSTPSVPGAEPTPAETFTQQQLDDELTKIFGPSKAERIANNETTAAQNSGGDAAVDATVGLSAQDTWDIHPELSRGGVCVNCRALANVTRDKWAITPLSSDEGHQFTIVEPGNAVGCNCTTRYANLERVAQGAA